MIGSQFVLRPLLPYLVQSDQFMALTLSQHRVRLLSGDRRELTPLEAPELPDRMEILIATDQGRKQVHVGGADPTHRHSSIYHGHGGKPDAKKDEIASFLRRLVDPLRALLPRDGTPVILAGVTSLLSLFREIFDHPALAQQQLEESCDHISDAELHRRIWPLMETVLDEERARKSADAFAGADNARCSSDPHVIVSAAHLGGVEVLVAAHDARLYGTREGKHDAAPDHAGGERAEDLVDLAAIDTLRHRGRVYVLNRDQVPGFSDMAAVLRRGWTDQVKAIAAQ